MMAEDWRTAYGRAKMELEEYKDTIVPALTKTIRELGGQWINAAAEKPTEFESVLVYVPGNKPLPTVCEAYLAKRCWVTRALILEEHEVTHWMPMPAPPEKVYKLKEY